MRAAYATGRRGFGGHHRVDLRLETRTSPQYGAAKAAEIYLAIELGRELAPERIRVNAVSPGSILFPGGGWDSLRERDPERFERFIERDLPFGRLGTPEEVADVVAFLLSERASWISGTHICVDGAQGRASASAW